MKVNFVSLWLDWMIGPIAAALILAVAAQAQASRSTVDRPSTEVTIRVR